MTTQTFDFGINDLTNLFNQNEIINDQNDEEMDGLAMALASSTKIDLIPKAVFKVYVVYTKHSKHKGINTQLHVIDTSHGRYWVHVYEVSATREYMKYIRKADGIILNQLKSYRKSSEILRQQLRKIVGKKTPIIFRVEGRGNLISYTSIENILGKILGTELQVHPRIECSN